MNMAKILSLSSFVLLSLALACFVGRASAANGGKVVTLNDANFKETLQQNKFVLLAWEGPGCDSCEELATKLDEAAATLHAAGSPVVVARCDGNYWGLLREEYGVRRYPTLQWLKYGEMRPYSGSIADAKSIVEWATRKGRSWAAQPDSPDKLAALEEAEMAIVLGYFKVGCCGSEGPAACIHAQKEAVGHWHLVYLLRS